RPPARAAHDRRQRRDDAARPLPDRARRGKLGLAPVRSGDQPGASQPPVRGQQRLRPRAREARAPHLGHLGGEAARRDHRDPGAPALRGRAVPPRVPLAALGPAPALRRFHPGRAGARGRMTTRPVTVGPITIGGGSTLVLIGGPCAIENEKHALVTAERIATIAADRRVPFIYKSSYDKANRSSVRGYRGPGLTEGLRILRKVRDTLGVPVLSDVHQEAEVARSEEHTSE